MRLHQRQKGEVGNRTELPLTLVLSTPQRRPERVGAPLDGPSLLCSECGRHVPDSVAPSMAKPNSLGNPGVPQVLKPEPDLPGHAPQLAIGYLGNPEGSTAWECPARVGQAGNRKVLSFLRAEIRLRLLAAGAPWRSLTGRE